MAKKPSQILSENKLIQLFTHRYKSRSPLLRKGIGDDAAVIQPSQDGEYWLITTDMLMEGVDFQRRWTTPQLLGCKSIAVNLSDLAAMGARPRFFTVSLALPRGFSESWVLEFYDGLTREANSQRAKLIGGDLSRSENGIAISITAVGESLNRKVLYRTGGKAGDLLYVTGVLGRSAAGLRLLQNGSRTRSCDRQEALRAHQAPKARCDAGFWLAQSGIVSCMMDISDGLSMDLPRMCAACGAGARIRAADLPVFSESSRWGCDPLEIALNGGEDYELLFAVPESKRDLLESSYPAKFPRITRIGELTRHRGQVSITGQDMKPHKLLEAGFDHFK